MNQYGRRLRMSIMGESHGHGVGIVLDGVPPGLAVDEDAIRKDMQARRPGSGPLVSSRQEADEVHLSSGVYDGHTTGAPITLWIVNEDTRSKDYSQLRRTPRPGHSDWVAGVWARGYQDHRGGGHYSGRLTAPLVAAAALLRPLLSGAGIETAAHLQAVGPNNGPAYTHPARDMQEAVADSPVHTAHKALEATFIEQIEAARNDRDSVGGVVEFRADGVPAAWGDPFFDSIESVLSHLFFAVPAIKGVSFGEGFRAATLKGSEHNDPYEMVDGQVKPRSNHAGGILGGRSDGAPIWGHVAVKPSSSIFQPQDTVDLETGENATLELKGRHDPCIAVRAVPVIRACLDLGLCDLLLLARQQGHAEAGT